MDNSGQISSAAALQAVELEVSSGSCPTISIHKPFDPLEYDLDAGFRLTKYSELRG
jgi:hypothetical protein